jgi:hypothetical protein
MQGPKISTAWRSFSGEQGEPTRMKIFRLE